MQQFMLYFLLLLSMLSLGNTQTTCPLPELYWDAASGACLPCPAGHYCVSFRKIACPAGHYQPLQVSLLHAV